MPERRQGLTPELAAFLESGLSLAVATCDAQRAPSCAFAGGVRASPDGARLTLFLPTVAAASAIRDLRAGCDIALTASRPADYRTVQIKGRVVRVATAGDGDRAFVSAYREALAAQLEKVGTVPELTRRLALWPSTAVEVEIRQLFEQTPGPRAGAPLEPP